MAFKARGIQNYGLGNVYKRVNRRKGRRIKAAPKATNKKDNTSKMSASGGSLANVSDTDIKLSDARRRLGEAKQDRRYYNEDGSAKTGGEVAQGFKESEEEQQKASDSNKVKNFSYIADDVMSKKPNKDGFTELSEESTGRLRSIFPDIVTAKKGTSKDVKDFDKTIYQIKKEGNNYNLYIDGEKYKGMSPTVNAFETSAKFGYIDRLQGDAINKSDQQQISPVEKENIITARDSIKALNKKISDIVGSDMYQGTPEQIQYITELNKQVIGTEKYLSSIGKTDNRTPYDGGILQESKPNQELGSSGLDGLSRKEVVDNAINQNKQTVSQQDNTQSNNSALGTQIRQKKPLEGNVDIRSEMIKLVSQLPEYAGFNITNSNITNQELAKILKENKITEVLGRKII